MRQKLALVTLLCILITCLLGLGNPNDPLTWLVSNNLTIILAKLVFGALVVSFAYHLKCGSILLRTPIALGGLAVIGLAVAVIFSTPILGALYNYLRILDILLIAQAGVVLVLSALEMKPAPSATLAKLRAYEQKWATDYRAKFKAYRTA